MTAQSNGRPVNGRHVAAAERLAVRQLPRLRKRDRRQRLIARFIARQRRGA
jgi:hypothetical protein